jgi:predicted HAD superfamily Cof-like phosphohydrolase
MSFGLGISCLTEFSNLAYKKTGDAGHEINQRFVNSTAVSQLAGRLVEEEAEEVVNALASEDLTDVIKELCDVLYVTFRVAVIYGIDEKTLSDAFADVHANNCKKIKECTIRPDGKIIKSKDHPKVDMKKYAAKVRKNVEEIRSAHGQ